MSPQIRNIATVGGNIMQDRRCIYFNQPHLWRSGLAYCFKTGGSICHQIPNSPVCRAIYYSDVATALIAYEAEVEYIEEGERSGFYKYAMRTTIDFPIINFAPRASGRGRGRAPSGRDGRDGGEDRLRRHG